MWLGPVNGKAGRTRASLNGGLKGVATDI